MIIIFVLLYYFLMDLIVLMTYISFVGIYDSIQVFLQYIKPLKFRVFCLYLYRFMLFFVMQIYSGYCEIYLNFNILLFQNLSQKVIYAKKDRIYFLIHNNK